MIAAFSLLLILLTLLAVHRMASTLLELTGLARDASRLQALSALTGTGFTTKESELIIEHPIRRRVAMALMLVGNTGIVTVMASVVVGFLELRNTTNGSAIVFTMVVGAVGLLLLAHSRWFNLGLERIVLYMSRRWHVTHVLDYAELLQVGRGFSVCTRMVQPADWIAGKSLSDTRLRAEGVIVLGVFHPDGSFEGAPRGGTILSPGDRVVVYGLEADLLRVGQRMEDGEVRETESPVHPTDIGVPPTPLRAPHLIPGYPPEQ